MITVEPTGCHDGCVTIKGGDHEPEVNPCHDGRWRLECNGCGTVLSIFDTRDQAIDAGKEHAVDEKAWDWRLTA